MKLDALRIIDKARKEGRKILLEPEAKTICRLYNIPVTVFDVATTANEAVEKARKIGFPIVMKIISPDVVHKSDVGGVLVNVKNEEEVKAGFDKIIENVRKKLPNARIKGILIQEMAPQGIETIIGGINDPQFGPTVMFGLGGIFVEVLKDVSFRVAPISKDEAIEMIEEIKSCKVLKGYRGYYKADIEGLAVAIEKVSHLISELPIDQLDLNPVFAYEEGKGVKVIDARIILQ
ncbi:MAG: acetyl-CoA synthetase [Thermoprotei archaeon]|nr:MAG: acetyl-CoA synthetase [Thermoprotei archaeon]